MLTRGSSLKNFCRFNYRNFSSSSEAFSGYESRINSLKREYPSLFGSSFISDQESLLSSLNNNISTLLPKYNDACDSIDSNSGENVFIKYDNNNLPLTKPIYTIIQKDEQVKDKLNIGGEYVSELISINDVDGLSVEDANLRMIKIAGLADKIDDWRNRLNDDIDDTTDLGLPITDAELDQWVNYQYFHAPGYVRDQGILSNEEFQKIEQEWLEQLDEQLIDILKNRLGSSFDESKWRNFTNITNELFHPHNIDHYTLSNYAKSLFRAGLWQGEDRLKVIEASMNELNILLNDVRDNDVEIIRKMYENNPDFKFKNLIALQLEITDPLFAAKLCDIARSTMEEIAINRAVKDILRDLELPMINKELSEWESELRESMSTNPSTMKRKIKLLTEEKESFEIEVPTLDAVLDDILPKKLWNNDISGVKQAILNYAKGSGSLITITDEIRKTMNPDIENGLLNDNEKLQYAIEYHNARYENKDNWNLKDLLKSTNVYTKVQERIISKRIVKKRLDLLGYDPLVVNLIRILIDDKKTNGLQQIILDYIDIMKRFRGEIDAVVMTPIKLDDMTLNSIENAMVSANPGKKITLKEQIEPSLSAGFIVKAGVQRFDFSLATVIHEGRKSVA